MSKFYEFYQNNSWGKNMGPAKIVYVEAADPIEANERAKEAGIYFDPYYRVDCECCGTRWEEASEYGSQPSIEDILKYHDNYYKDEDILIVFENGSRLRTGNRR